MYPLVLAAILAALIAQISHQALENFDLMKLYRFNLHRMQLVMLAESLEQYYNERGTFPSSIQNLATTPGYAHVRSLVNNWQGFAVSGTLSDTMWQYRRMVVYSIDSKNGESQATYLANNSCGTGTFYAAASWCGHRKSTWYLKDTRYGLHDQVITQRARLRRTLQKFGDFYSANERFPDRNSSGTALTPGETYSLPNLAGYTGSASACTGMYLWNGLPIGCDDMFDSWGAPINITIKSDQNITMFSESPLTNASGQRVIIASGFSM